ncbi:glycoside hydrolase family 3 protein [Stackebrandtia soli]|uniref:glycoside hydrolase family 3 protein n=1 Tax=Stackebrandtia soli TaxID=1892856 RepID=UPI0039EBC487
MTNHKRPSLTVLFSVVAALSLSSCGGVAEPSEAPQGRPGDAHEIWAASVLADMTLAEKVGQMFTTYAYGATADTTDPADVARNRDFLGVDNAAQAIETYHLGGVIYFGWSGNLNSPQQILELSNGMQDAALAQPSQVPLLISTDQEHGIVTRMPAPATAFAGNMALAATGSAQDARTAATITATELRAVGINQDFAPVADVNVNPDNPVIGVRSFSSDPALAAECTAAQVKGFQQSRYPVAAAAKHFPGHGDTSVDSHTDLPVIDHTRQEWEEYDAPPFSAAIDAGIDVIMSAHIQFPALDPSGDPATLSEPIMTGLLRGELGFDGVIVTDSLSMAGVNELYPPEEVPVRAINAGVDMLLMPPNLEQAIGSVLAAIDSGEIAESRIDESVLRILALKHKRGIVDEPHADPDQLDKLLGTPQNKKRAAAITARGVTLVVNDDETLPLAGDTTRTLVVGPSAGRVDDISSQLDTNGLPADSFVTAFDPDAAEIEAAVDAASGASAIVVATSTVASNPGQADLVAALSELDAPVIVVAVKEPYDINRLTGVDAYLATYAYTDGALRAAADVIAGELNPTGTLPVSIPDAEDPGTPLYELGHGLRYPSSH